MLYQIRKRLPLIALVACILGAPMIVRAINYARQSYVQITNSFLDSSPVGSVTPSTGAFTTLTASSGYSGAVTTSSLSLSGTQHTGDVACWSGSTYLPCQTTVSSNLLGAGRAAGTVYQNTSGYKLTVDVTPSICCGGSAAGEWDIYIGTTTSIGPSFSNAGFLHCASTSNGTGIAGMPEFIVPPGYYYGVFSNNHCGGSGGSSLFSWFEFHN